MPTREESARFSAFHFAGWVPRPPITDPWPLFASLRACSVSRSISSASIGQTSFCPPWQLTRQGTHRIPMFCAIGRSSSKASSTFACADFRRTTSPQVIVLNDCRRSPSYLALCPSSPGHYAQIWQRGTGSSVAHLYSCLALTFRTGRVSLMRGADDTKDQSYFLSNVSEEALKRSIFPVGHLSKL